MGILLSSEIIDQLNSPETNTAIRMLLAPPVCKFTRPIIDADTRKLIFTDPYMQAGDHICKLFLLVKDNLATHFTETTRFDNKTTPKCTDELKNLIGETKDFQQLSVEFQKLVGLVISASKFQATTLPSGDLETTIKLYNAWINKIRSNAGYIESYLNETDILIKQAIGSKPASKYSIEWWQIGLMSAAIISALAVGIFLAPIAIGAVGVIGGLAITGMAAGATASLIKSCGKSAIERKPLPEAIKDCGKAVFTGMVLGGIGGAVGGVAAPAIISTLGNTLASSALVGSTGAGTAGFIHSSYNAYHTKGDLPTKLKIIATETALATVAGAAAGTVAGLISPFLPDGGDKTSSSTNDLSLKLYPASTAHSMIVEPSGHEAVAYMANASGATSISNTLVREPNQAELLAQHIASLRKQLVNSRLTNSDYDAYEIIFNEELKELPSATSKRLSIDELLAAWVEEPDDPEEVEITPHPSILNSTDGVIKSALVFAVAHPEEKLPEKEMFIS
ncbi:MAG: hypothetical protein Q7V63_07030 [Gammaproteobacteria bacterium]|nr:hypothetical protein [Gammaproteobacteria bacterium]